MNRAPAGIRKITGSSCVFLGADPAPWRPAVAAAEIRRRPGFGRSPAAAASPGCRSGRPGGRLTAAAEIRRRQGSGRSPAAAASPGCRSGRPGGRPWPLRRSSAGGILGITGSSCVFLGADPAPWRQLLFIVFSQHP